MKKKKKVTAPEKQDRTAPKAKESSANKTSDSGVSHERGGIVKDVMFSVIIVTGLDTLKSIVGRNSKRMQKLQENQQGIPLKQGLIDRRRRERACNYVYVLCNHQNSNARAGYTINSL